MNKYLPYLYCLLAFTLGWAVSKHSHGDEKKNAEPVNKKPSISSRREIRDKAQANFSALPKEITENQDPAAQIQALIHFTRSMPLGNIAAWLSKNYHERESDFLLSTACDLLLERFKAEDFDAYFLWAEKSPSDIHIASLCDLAERDYQKFHDFFVEKNDPTLMGNVLRNLAMRNPSLALQFFTQANPALQEFMHKDYFAIAELEKTYPDQMASYIAALSMKDRDAYEKHKMTFGLIDSFSTTLPKLIAHPKGLNILLETKIWRPNFGDKIFQSFHQLPKEWRDALGEDPAVLINNISAKQWLKADLSSYGWSDFKINDLRIAAFKTLAKLQPEEAIEIAFQVGEKDSKQLAKYIDTIFLSLPGKISSDRHTRLIILYKKMCDPLGNNAEFQSNVNVPNNHESPSEGQRFNELSEDQKNLYAMGIVFSDNNFNPDKKDAFSFMLKNRVTKNMESCITDKCLDYVTALGEENTPEAARLLQSMPDQPIKKQALKNIADQWRQYDPDEAEQWIQSLPPADQESIKK